MWKIFQKEALGIFRYTSRIDFFKIPDHVELSEFTEMQVTLKTNSVCFSVRCTVQYVSFWAPESTKSATYATNQLEQLEYVPLKAIR